MHIKSLEIIGFKSFVDRTVIPFDQDVIGIVGPNGCGKSNIVDAIRWCMGEQSAKHLRGKAMQDVIFSGSETRQPTGLAEVTITFDNSDARAAMELPIEYRDWAEIAVTRRLHRDGTSDYLLNKTPVRLKDITDLFLGTGVGTKAYSIVEQGKIGLIVSARPEDRRLLIEEAAGITKYKHRRRQAEQKMDLTRQNLARVGDIVAEIERTLASLRRQAQKAERYKAYREELEQLMLHEASHRYLELVVVTQVQATSLAEVTEEGERARAELAAKDAELEASRARLYDLEAKNDDAQSAAFEAVNEVRALEAEIVRAKDRLAHLDTRRVQATAEREAIVAQRDALAAEAAALEARLGAMDDESAQEADVALSHHERLEELRSSEQEAQSHLGSLRARTSAATSKVATATAKLDGHARRLSDLGARREKLVLEADTLRTEAGELTTRRDTLAEQLSELQEGKRLSADQKLAYEGELTTVREALGVAERELDHAKNELSQRRNRLRALEELSSRHEGVGAGAKHLLEAGDDTVVGLVANLILAPKELTQALAGFLGGRLEDVVVRDTERGAALLDSLFAQKKGRATVVAASPPVVVGHVARLTGAGVVGSLRELVEHRPEHALLARHLMGDAVVVETKEHAEALRRAHRDRDFVTLDGTVFHRDGRVTGGAGDAVGAGLLEQQREIRELGGVVGALSEDVSRRVELHQELRHRAVELAAHLDRARREAHESELALVTTEKDLRRTEDQLTSNARRLEAVLTDTTDVEDALAQAADEESDARADLESGEEELRDAEAATETAEGIADEWRERVAAQQSIVTEQKIRLARLKEQADGVRHTAERLRRSVEELDERATRLEKELFEIAEGVGSAGATIMTSKERLLDAVELARGAEAARDEARRDFDEAKTALAERESGQKDLRARAEELSARQAHHDKQVTRLALEVQHLLSGVEEKFRGLDLRRIIGDYHAKPAVDDEHRARITELGQLIDRMGSVNLDAVREHAEAEERFTFFTTQKADLDGALADLEAAIAQMDQESKKLFKDTFESVNEKFQAVFPRMFRGGTARLQLTQPDDLLETGVEILAQPPGKKVGNIELMSGGEKALTAVSLIFAMFQHKPSPFCILDEVDAPLDEANVARYNEAIRSMTDRSQFILITHIKRTMQSVDTLFGVTMQEPGVSKLVSVKVNDAAQKRSQAPATTAVA